MAQDPIHPFREQIDQIDGQILQLLNRRAAAALEIPACLLDELEPEGGRMVIPVGPDSGQDMILLRRSHTGIDSQSITGCRFVPLRGAQGS